MRTLNLGLAPIAFLLPTVAVSSAVSEYGLFMAQFDHILGTSLELKIVSKSYSDARLAQQRILSEMERLTNCLSSYQSDSEFSRWLAAPPGVAFPVSGDLFAILTLFDHWREQTNGALNAAAEHLGQLWQQVANHQKLLTETARQQAIAAVNQTHWLLNTDNLTATRLTNVPICLNTFTKSYVLDRAAEVALKLPGVAGLMLNSGGDILVRGSWQEIIAVANPRAHAENAAPIARVQVQNATVATSGDYRRGVQIGTEWFSHLMNPRTGLPARDIISATVLHPDAVTAGALATAFTILTPSESASLAAQRPGTEYLLVSRDGQTHSSAGWAGLAVPAIENTPGSANGMPTKAYLLSVSAKEKLWNPTQELLISLELPRFEGRSHRPFVAIWIEDESGKPVRQLALWYNKPRWLHDLREWYGLQTTKADAVTSATRSPGEYTLAWDGKDDEGQWVKQGKYRVLIEAAREHGSYQVIRQVMDFNGKPQQQTLNGNVEIKAAALDYREKSATR